MNRVRQGRRSANSYRRVSRRSCKKSKSELSNREAILNWKHAGLCALIVVCLSLPASAQKGGTGGGGGRAPAPSPAPRASSPPIYGGSAPPIAIEQPLPTTPDIPPPSRPVVIEDENCLPWNVSSVRDTAVSVTRLKVPGNARSEYQKACEANVKNKFVEAEKHARAAIDKFEAYSAAWVMLGVVLEQENKHDEARDACTHAVTKDSKYLPGYLCQAEFANRDRQWDKVANLADLALGLNSAGDGYAYYYRATALFHQNHLAQAKKSAEQAEEIDINRNQVPLSFLLAEIHEAEGNKDEAIAQLRQILKHHLEKPQEAAVKQYLADLEAPPAATNEKK